MALDFASDFFELTDAEADVIRGLSGYYFINPLLPQEWYGECPIPGESCWQDSKQIVPSRVITSLERRQFIVLDFEDSDDEDDDGRRWFWMLTQLGSKLAIHLQDVARQQREMT